jgi:hypothetical protein
MFLVVDICTVLKNAPELKPNTHLELTLVTNRCKEAFCSTGDILLAVAAYF